MGWLCPINNREHLFKRKKAVRIRAKLHPYCFIVCTVKQNINYMLIAKMLARYLHLQQNQLHPTHWGP